MSTTKWIATLLRARSAKEDQAKQDLGQARRAQQIALAHAADERRRAASMHASGNLSTPNFLAMIAARSAATATAHQAQRTAEQASVSANLALDALVVATQRRRTAEILSEREAEIAAHEEQLAQARQLDEIAATTHRNNVEDQI